MSQQIRDSPHSRLSYLICFSLIISDKVAYVELPIPGRVEVKNMILVEMI